jgi:hypothetical protein
MDDLYILFKCLNVHENIRKPTREQEVQERGDEALKEMEKKGVVEVREQRTQPALSIGHELETVTISSHQSSARR